MPKNYLSETLELKAYTIEKVENIGLKILIHCHSKTRGMWYKAQYSKKVAETKVRQVAHMMLENKQIVLIITQRRFVFKGTRKWEVLPDVEQYKQTTNTFRLHTLRELQRDNYSGSGSKRHKSGMFPMKLLDDLTTEFTWEKGIVRVGLDGKAIKGHQGVHHVANLDTGKSITVFPNLSQFQLKKNS